MWRVEEPNLSTRPQKTSVPAHLRPDFRKRRREIAAADDDDSLNPYDCAAVFLVLHSRDLDTFVIGGDGTDH